MGGFFVAKFVKLPIALYYYVCYNGCKERNQDTAKENYNGYQHNRLSVREIFSQ